MQTLCLKDANTGAVIVSHVNKAHNPFTRLKGLMFKAELPEGHGLWIKPCSSIHSCFMRFEFDAVFLDKEFNVIHCIHSMAPWKASPILWKAHSVVELPAGTLKKHGISESSKVTLE